MLSARPLPDLTALEEGLRLLRETDLRDVLADVRQPTLVIHGDRDELVPFAAGEYLRRCLPHGALQAIPGAAHAPFVSAPDDIARRIAEHFR
jgi:pimeloyl-[acyl-carrier protein] methyl ester esterase